MKTSRTKLFGLVAVAMVTAVLSSTPGVAWADEPPPPPSAPPSPPPARVSRRAVAWGAAGVALAGTIGAAVFGVLALQNKTSYEGNPTFSNTDNGNNFAAYTDGCIALAAAAGVTSIVLFLTSPASADGTSASAKKAGSLSAAPLVTAHGGGVGAVLSF